MRGAVRGKDKETKTKQGHISSPEPSGASTWVLPQRRRSPPVGFGDGSAVAAASSNRPQFTRCAVEAASCVPHIRGRRPTIVFRARSGFGSASFTMAAADLET
ncbi:hypothetical protein MTO96_041440 [Rhipicephalus appendiculatus]